MQHFTLEIEGQPHFIII